MKNEHYTFLKPFFETMNENFVDKWCVLHSYETLPNFSDSDVDMALNHADIGLLESLILKVANNTGWTFCQKLWYDVPKCFYYVLRNDNEGTYLAIDFLIDPKGIGRYGFNTETLTSNCEMHENLFPIPNHAVAFTYKLVKRIVKRRSMLSERDYLVHHLDNADKVVVKEIILKQFGKKGLQVIELKLEINDFEFSKKEEEYLIKLKRKNAFLRLKPLSKIYWEIFRVSNRIFKPKGLIINIPLLSDKELHYFKIELEHKVGLLFRFVKLSKAPFVKTNLVGLVGSTLVINSSKALTPDKAIIKHWLLGSKFHKIDNIEFVTVDEMVEVYFKAIVEILISRKGLA
ncbi:hypothetical protein LCGC14_0119160 [marine sediment metagenome]|uniref:Uncharacterized protein n=1 Tax=marine sediment metagenome TaxID=412755 RepID=A0A0F9VN75_9ZZZZ|nr:hypothetical protein [Maribacter sp.]HDZ07420.1 hypothetical protein [Maribacter sp.]HEA79887.1 hypothetical protein [Maribacter sp.]